MPWLSRRPPGRSRLNRRVTYSCAVFADRRHDARGRAGRQVRARLPQARAASRACGCSTSAAVGAGWCMHAAREHGVHAVGRDALAPAGRVGAQARRARPASPTGSRSACRTTATSSTARSTRSARSACSSTSARRKLDEYFTRCYALLAPGRPAAQPRHRRPAEPRGGRASRTAGFIDRYVFPDGELHEVGTRGVARCSGPASRSRHVEGLREHYALDAAALGREPRGELGRGGARWSARAGRGCGGSTWPRRRSTSSRAQPDPPGARGPQRRPTARATCPAAPTGNHHPRP